MKYFLITLLGLFLLLLSLSPALATQRMVLGEMFTSTD